MKPVESSRLWASFDRAVFDCGAVMRGSDVSAKIGATFHLQTLLEDLELALEKENDK
jgi:hypothetical protein